MADREASRVRVRAVEILRQALRRGEEVPPLLASREAGLPPQDRDLLREIVYGVLRHRATLDSELASVSRAPLARLEGDLREILEVGLYQIRRLDRVPAYAAVDEAVRHARSRSGERAAKLVNAVLRRLADRPAPPAAGGTSEAELARQSSHPEFLVRRWVERFGRAETCRILEFDNAPSAIDLLVNPRRTDIATLRRALEAEGVTTEPSPLSPLALTVTAGNPIGSPLLSEGHFTVQDVGAQALALLLPPGDLLVDLAAAPGGKTFAALALGRARRAIALDRSVARLGRLTGNARRLDETRVHVAAGDFLAPPLPAARFDRVILDAPCSGTGTLRKNPEIRYRLTPAGVEDLARTQTKALAAAADLLEPGGYLLYATCSLEAEENERVVEELLPRRPELALQAIEAPDTLRPFVAGARFRLFPGERTDGFTAHLLRRKTENGNGKRRIPRTMTGATVPLLDLTRYDDDLNREIASSVAEVFSTGRFIMGPPNAAFEKAFAELTGARHAIGVSSGTDALLVALMALGVGPGDEVVTTPFSFFASAGVVARLGARPVFADIEPETFNLDPDRLARAITPRTKAVMPVHLYGQTADMDPIREVCGAIPIVEDACQSVGAKYRGRSAGVLGTMAAFSFYPTKNLGGAGDAGAVTTDDGPLAALLASLRLHGESERYHHARVGGNFRMDSVQAAVLLAKMPRLEGWTERRIAIAQRYGELLWDAEMKGRVVLPVIASGRRHVFHQYVVRVNHRDRVRAKLAERGISTAVFYPVPFHLQECFSGLGYSAGDFPVSEKAAQEVLALPMFPQLTDAEVARVAEELVAALA